MSVGQQRRTRDSVANPAADRCGRIESRLPFYNSMGQLIGLVSNSVNMSYNYSATQNNGKITGPTDYVSAETVVYAHDALNRLASAATTAGTSWGLSFNYDGFGDLTDQNVTAGSVAPLHVVYIGSNNCQSTDCADANGNINSTTNCLNGYNYDVSNRIVGVPGNTAYAYAPAISEYGEARPPQIT